MTRRVYNIVTDERGQPISGVSVRIQLNVATFVSGEQKEIVAWGIETSTNEDGYWEVNLEPNDLMSDPNSYYKIIEYSYRHGKINEYYIRVPSSGYTEPIHIMNLLITLPPVTPSSEAVTGIAADNNALMRGDIRLLSGTGIELQQDNNAKTITIVNTGGGGGGGSHNLLSNTHTDTQPTTVQRGMLIVGQLVSGVLRWAGLAIGAAGKFLKSNGTDVVWDNVTWNDVQNKPSTFPPSSHTHVKSDITDFAHTHVKADITDFAHTHPPSQITPQGSGSGLDADTVDGQHASAFAPATHTHSASDITSGRLSASRLPTSSTANRFLVVRTANSDPTYDTIQASDLPSHSHTQSQITDLETITTTPTANAVPKADSAGKIAIGWIPQGSGSNLDADKLDGLDSTDFERVINKGAANGYAPLDSNAKLPLVNLTSHASTHASGGSDPITGSLEANARVKVRSNGTDVGTRRAINFIAGSNITLNIVDDVTNEEVDVTIASTGGGVGLDVYPKVLTPGSSWDDTTDAALWEIVTYTNTKQEVIRYRDNAATQRWWEFVVLDASNLTGSFKIVWSSPVSAPSGGDAVVWEVGAGVINAGGSVDPTLTVQTATGTRDSNENANIQKETTVTLSLSGVQNGSRIIVRVRRLGADSSDTLNGDVRLHKVVVD